MYRASLLLFFGIALAANAVGLPTSSSNNLDAEQIRAANLVLQGFRDSLERLHSGVCRIQGNTITTRTENGHDIIGNEPIDCLCAFDFGNGLYRFDRNVRQKDGVIRGGKFLRNPPYSYVVLGVVADGPITSIIRNTADSEVNESVNPFDIRCIGCYPMNGLLVGRSIETFLQALSSAKLVEFSEETKAVVRVAWLFRPESRVPSKETYWFDRERGYTLIRRECLPSGGNVPYKQVEETSWERRGGAWVPIALRADDNQLPGKLRMSADWRIVWESVNDNVNKKYFVPDDLAMGQRVAVFDESLGKSVLIGYTSDTATQQNAVRMSAEKSRMVLVAVCSALLIILIAVFTTRQVKRRRTIV